MSERFHSRLIAMGVMLLTAVALAGCATGGGAPGGTPSLDGRQAPTVRTEPDTPASFTDRIPLPSCGSVELGQAEAIPQDAIDCLTDAGAQGAELVVTTLTVEGDEIVTYYRALPEGGIEVFTDMTKDAFGGGWAHEVCADATTVGQYGGCAEATG
jgi:hypothetical protein